MILNFPPTVAIEIKTLRVLNYLGVNLLICLCCAGLSCAPHPPANSDVSTHDERSHDADENTDRRHIDTSTDIFDPFVTRKLTFKNLSGEHLKGSFAEIIQPDGQVALDPMLDVTVCKTLFVRARASTMAIVLDVMREELEAVEKMSSSSMPALPSSTERAVPIAETGALPMPFNNAEIAPLPDTDTEGRSASDPARAVQRTYLYHVKHGSASGLKRLLDEVYRGDTAQASERKISSQMPSVPRFIASDVALNKEDYSLSGGWDNLQDLPGAVGNFLIILATQPQYESIQQLLKQIDSQPLQVFLNMLIAEVTLLDGEVLGIEETLFRKGQISVGGETIPFSSIGTTEFQEVADNIEGFRYAILAPGRFLFKLRALANENRVRMLSNPHIFVRNNRKAKIHIGETIPVVTHETTTDGNVKETVDPRETGITMAVIPSINPDGNIHLEIMQEVTDIGSENYAGTGQASFIKRMTRTAFDIPDSSYIMLGGLRLKTQEKVEKGIPLLKDIPGLGVLFKSTSTDERKTELILLIRAEIVSSYEDEYEIFDRVYEQTQPWLEPESPYIESHGDRIKRQLKELLQGKGDVEGESEAYDE